VATTALAQDTPCNPEAKDGRCVEATGYARIDGDQAAARDAALRNARGQAVMQSYTRMTRRMVESMNRIIEGYSDAMALGMVERSWVVKEGPVREGDWQGHYRATIRARLLPDTEVKRFLRERLPSDRGVMVIGDDRDGTSAIIEALQTALQQEHFKVWDNDLLASQLTDGQRNDLLRGILPASLATDLLIPANFLLVCSTALSDLPPSQDLPGVQFFRLHVQVKLVPVSGTERARELLARNSSDFTLAGLDRSDALAGRPELREAKERVATDFIRRFRKITGARRHTVTLRVTGLRSHAEWENFLKIVKNLEGVQYAGRDDAKTFNLARGKGTVRVNYNDKVFLLAARFNGRNEFQAVGYPDEDHLEIERVHTATAGPASAAR